MKFRPIKQWGETNIGIASMEVNAIHGYGTGHEPMEEEI